MLEEGMFVYQGYNLGSGFEKYRICKVTKKYAYVRIYRLTTGKLADEYRFKREVGNGEKFYPKGELKEADGKRLPIPWCVDSILMRELYEWQLAREAIDHIEFNTLDTNQLQLVYAIAKGGRV